MSFADAIKICFQKYMDFNGRAKRPEFWWFALFCVLVSVGLSIVSSALSSLFSLATLLPSLAVGARRLHDTNRSGWLQLIWIIPVIGWIIMIVLLAQQGSSEDNQYGSTPAN
ncbi:MAG: DUF805 domain-containing protein [Betaproteobacteria bacterium HGW-Betaproteobacteria-1]|jgi:uncharacterized membrane protein YhaH (DUF805 family)|nr:MAG: DUF805 domain-containing protein [Betaproteobacteria bacterium HGW-Betaproteobacteria-1]